MLGSADSLIRNLRCIGQVTNFTPLIFGEARRAVSAGAWMAWDAMVVLPPAMFGRASRGSRKKILSVKRTVCCGKRCVTPWSSLLAASIGRLAP
jgi:hypothetical protein